MLISGTFPFLGEELKSPNFVIRPPTMLILILHFFKRGNITGKDRNGRYFLRTSFPGELLRMIYFMLLSLVECGAIAFFFMPENKTAGKEQAENKHKD